MSAQQSRRQPPTEVAPQPPPLATDSSSSSTNNPKSTIPSIETSNTSQHQKASRSNTNDQTSSTSQPIFRVPESPRSGPSAPSPKAAKIAIPRLKRSLDGLGENAIRAGGRHRVNHACEPCRHRKTKCSGERPVCRHCQDFKLTCYYADGKRDRAKKQFGSMSEKVTDYEKLLKDLVTRVGDADAKRIRASLEKDMQSEVAQNESENLTTNEPDAEDEESGKESEASAGAGSTGALDRADEDFTQDSLRSTGFMGKNSEVTWLQRLRQVNREEEDEQTRPSRRDQGSNRKLGGFKQVALSKEHESAAATNYHLDDLAISTFEAIDPFEMPTMETAHQLFRTFFERVYPTFPVAGYSNLYNQFQKFMNGQIQSPPDKWLAIVNLIFAISARYSHLIQAEWKGDERDHLIYFSRARMLALNDTTWLTHPDLQQIQVYALASFYLMSTGQINRSWLLCGIAIRCATGLGMNVRNDSPELKNSLKEIRYRMWWAIYVLEHRLCSMTGRANCVVDDHCTTPLPVPLSEDKFESDEGRKMLSKEHQQSERRPLLSTQSSSAAGSTPSTDRSRSASKPEASRSPSTQQAQPDMEWAKDVPPSSALYFLHVVQGARLTQMTYQKLYNPSVAGGTWSAIQSMIEECNNAMEIWYRNLPSVFDFKRNQRDRDFYDFRLTLGFLYYGSKIMINRPCLCRLDRRIPGQSNKSNDFNRQSAAQCVWAAVEMLRMIPNDPNAIGLRRAGPWWNLIHYLVQAATVLTLEISFRAHHMPEEADTIFESGKKMLRWLHALGEDDLSAKRAWNLTNQLFREAVTRIGRKLDDIPSQPPSAPDSVHANPAEISGLELATVPVAPFQAATFSPMNQENMSGVSHMPIYSHYDQPMHYDYYDLPMQQAMDDQMHFQQAELDMDFMNADFNPGGGTQGGQSGNQRQYN